MIQLSFHIRCGAYSRWERSACASEMARDCSNSFFSSSFWLRGSLVQGGHCPSPWHNLRAGPLVSAHCADTTEGLFPGYHRARQNLRKVRVYVTIQGEEAPADAPQQGTSSGSSPSHRRSPPPPPEGRGFRTGRRVRPKLRVRRSNFRVDLLGERSYNAAPTGSRCNAGAMDKGDKSKERESDPTAFHNLDSVIRDVQAENYDATHDCRG